MCARATSPRAPVRRAAAASSASGVFERVRDILEAARAQVVRTVNSSQVTANWLIGREIVEEEQRGQRRAGYGQQLLAQLSRSLTETYGRGWSVQTLAYTRQFYLTYPLLMAEVPGFEALRDAARNLHPPGGNSLARNLHPASGTSAPGPLPSFPGWQPGRFNPHLSWTHYRTLLRVDRPEARSFYEIEALRNAWSARELARQIDSLLYDRLARSRDREATRKLAEQGHAVDRPIDVLKDPLVLEFLDLPVAQQLTESDLERALLGNLQQFLLELGKGFAFLSRQERITLDGDHFYIDLVFYHAVLKCYVLIDLKVGKLTHSDLGQMQFYVNYFDRERRTPGDNPTLGLILCSDKNDAVVKYTLGEQLERNIFANRYQLHLPTEEELQRELQRELRQLQTTSHPSPSHRSDDKPTS